MGIERMTYKVNYTLSFVIFWGLALGFGLFIGGLLTLSVVLLMILFLHTHEYAHVRACQKYNVGIKDVYFSAFGGGVDVEDIKFLPDSIPIYMAGLIDTSVFCGVFVIPLFIIINFNPFCINIAPINPWLNLLKSISVFLIVMTISNIIPITFHSNKDGLIRTDGWAAWCNAELCREMWNDGKYISMTDR
jgi:hypothetical protein